LVHYVWKGSDDYQEDLTGWGFSSVAGIIAMAFFLAPTDAGRELWKMIKGD